MFTYRTLTLTYLALQAANTSFAQVQPGFHYTIPAGTTLRYKATSNSAAISVTTITDLKASIKQDKDTLTVRFWRFMPPFPATVNPANVNQTQNPYGFKISISRQARLSDPLNSITLRFRTKEIGVATIPFKYRFGTRNGVSSEASSGFNAGVYYGYKTGKTRFWENEEATANTFTTMTALFVTPTVIALNSANTDGHVQKDRSDFGMSVGLGFSVIIRSFSIGLVGGIDAPLTGNGQHWNYAYTPWLGFGLSYKAVIFGGG